MKILILQLARLGDIYMTWPVVRAIKRMQPQAEIQMMVRSRFEAATIGLSELDKVVVLPNKDILEPLVKERFDLEASCCRLELFLDQLEMESFDTIINLSFSPLSSYLTHYLEKPGMQVMGYTRHADGYLNFADEISAYFYAQVGPERSNRCHLADIFASMVGVTLEESDWASPNLTSSRNLGENYVVVHVGASETHKRLLIEEYAQLVKAIYQSRPHYNVVLIGAAAELEVANHIKLNVPVANIINLVGQTAVEELFPIVSGANLLIGCDSAPIHVASLTNTPTFNLSFGGVNFWETGPKAGTSFIKILHPMAELRDMESVAQDVEMVLNGQVPDSVVVRSAGLESYTIPGEKESSQFAWKLVQAMYLGGSYPVLDDFKVYQGLSQIASVNKILIERYQQLNPNVSAQVHDFIVQSDELLKTISRKVPEVRPIVDWLMTEKIRIPPMDFESVRTATLKIHQNLEVLLKSYIPQDEVSHGQV